MVEFYEKLKQYKSDNKLNNQQLADIVLMNADQFRMSVRREALSKLEIQKLEQVFNGYVTEPTQKEDEFTTLLVNKLFESETFKTKLLDYIKENATNIGEEEAIKYEAYLMDFIKEQERNKK
jgi:hypothetical protein